MEVIVAFQNRDIGIPVQFRTDRSIFNLRRLQAHTKTFAASSNNRPLLGQKPEVLSQRRLGGKLKISDGPIWSLILGKRFFNPNPNLPL